MSESDSGGIFRQWWKQFRSKHDHKGRCSHCGLSWRYVDHMKPVVYQSGEWRSSAAFPLCKGCYEDLSALEVAEYFERDWWDKDPDPVAFRVFRQNVMEDKRGNHSLNADTDWVNHD